MNARTRPASDRRARARGGRRWAPAIALAIAAASCDRPERPPAATADESDPAALLAAGALDEAAESIGRRIRDRELDLARALDLQVEILWRRGQGEGDEILAAARRAVELKRAAAAPAELGSSLVNLATLLFVRERYEEAKPLFEEALAVLEAGGDVSRRELANGLNAYGGLHQKLGDRRRARELFERALAIRRGLEDPGRRAQGATLINLALLLADVGEREEARRRFEEAEAIWNRPEFQNDAGKAAGMNNFAWLLHQMGEVERAESLYAAALELRRRALGAGHAHVAWTLYNLGMLELARGAHEKAAGFLEEALRIRRDACGPAHPLTAHALNAWGVLALARGDAAAALGAALEAESIALEHLRLEARGLNERLALRFAASRHSGLDLSLSALAAKLEARSDSAADRRGVWSAVLRGRAAVLDAMVARRRAARGVEADPELERLKRELDDATRDFAKLAAAGRGAESRDAFERRLAEARERKERAEEALARRSLAFAGARKLERADLDAVAARLPDGAELLAFVRFRRHVPKPGGAPELVPSYIAFSLAGGGDREPQAALVGDAGAIDGLVLRWREELLRVLDVPPSDAAAIAKAERELAALGGALRERLLRDDLRRGPPARLCFVVPDGELHRLPFGALPGRSDPGIRYLVEEERRIHYLTAERDLLLDPAPRRSDGDLLAIGGVDFGEAPAGPDPRGGEPCPGLDQLRFRDIPAAGEEAEAIALFWKSLGREVTLLSGAEASEERFLALAPGRAALHLATHGFFLSGDCPPQDGASPAGRTRGIGIAPEREGGEEDGAAAENPLLRSGLALAGANARARAAGGSRDDGILTAEEIGALGLERTDWAVLSACDTGSGRIQSGEGVLGLRRAFQAAGVKTLVLSLWPVDDEATRSWMAALYEARFGDGATAADAHRRACVQAIESCRARGLSTHPYFWAAFIAAGDWR